jgi:flagellar biosynthesis protein FliR
MEALVTAFALTLARVATFMHVLPMLGGNYVPRTVKIGASFALAVFFFDLEAMPLHDSAPLGWLGFALALGREMMLGGILGFALSLFLMPARIAGEFLAQECGLTFAHVMTASGEGSANPLAVILELFASLLLFSLDLHHLFLLTLQETFRFYPIGRPYALPSWDLIEAASVAQEGGILLVTPLVLCLFLATVVLMLMTRAAPQLNLYSVGFPLRILVCLCGLCWRGW